MEDNQDIQKFNMDRSPRTITKTFKKHFKGITIRPLSFFILLALVGLLLPSLLIPFLVLKIKGIEKELDSVTSQSHQEIWSVIQNATGTLLPMSSSATNLAKVANASLGKTDPIYLDIEAKVVPILFQALLTIPRLSQISYIRQDGLFFAFYSREHEQIYAIYSNTSFIEATKARKNYSWFKQPVASDTGRLYGEAVVFPPQLLFNDTWFQKALNTTDLCASLLKSLDHDNRMLVMNTARVDKNGVISLGFGVKSLIDVFSSIIKPFGGGLYLATKDGKELSDGIPNTHVVLEENTAISIQLMKANGDPSGTLRVSYKMPQAYNLDIQGTNYILYSSSVDIIGLQSVYVLVLPYDGVQSRMHKNIVFVMVLLLVMFVIVAVFIFHLAVLMARAARKEMCLKASLIRQKDATLQAERKSMNRSLAFASASHEIRTPLAGITSLVEMSIDLVPEGSEIAENLRLVNTCSERLYSILNSILDTSKMEAGEMQLEEKEFNLVKVVEDVVDLFYPVGLKKKVDVILDIQDPSLTKFSPVKGDEYRLQQILSNLVNNAIKFTKEGYVSVRAYARKPRLQCSTFTSTQDQPTSFLSCFFSKNNEKCNAIDEKVCLDTNFMEFVFEVNDTGIGIPKEKRASVFENYRRVIEEAHEEVGTGLGLGIVQSIVRLMGGEISIVDKVDERGTRFVFNVVFKVCRNGSTEGNQTPSPVNLSSGSNTPFSSPIRQDNNSSIVVLFISSDVRRRIAQEFMRAHKIKVLAVENIIKLSETLRKFTQEEHNVSSSGYDLNVSFSYLKRLGSRHSNTSPKNVPLCSMDGTDVSPIQRTNRVTNSRFMLLVVDTSQADFDELCKEVAKFRKNSKNYCFRVVWLGLQSMKVHGLDEKQLPPSDVIISMPLHGSRLYSLLDLIPGFRGTIPFTPPRGLTPQTQDEITRLRGMITCTPPRRHDEITSLGGMISCTPRHEHTPERQDEIVKLSAKKVLVAEDENVQQRIAKMILLKHGYTIEMCRNGNEALTMVSKGLSDQKNLGASHILPYDFILMDCQMPVMDGCEATRQIRLTENEYGVHIPIIGLTAHEEGEELEFSYLNVRDGGRGRATEMRKETSQMWSMDENDDEVEMFDFLVK
uniref:histidine kinase n=1 Tax=Tanacetum cinerariifolium TaxID=118510 RepID=A0A6L2KQ37_TANCI|nr:histidine kinase CKI1-like [Tanacetum cinerariifolium]